MSENIKEHDFIELDYTGRLDDGSVFDTTMKKIAEENALPTEKVMFKPTIICVGEKQILPGLDKNLIGKEIGKEYTITIPPEDAFGKRDIKKVKIVPLGTFKEHNVQPQPGLQIDVDGETGVVKSISGGRVIVNFNHVLAGRNVTYKINVNRKIIDVAEKVASFLTTMLRLPKDKMDIVITEKKAVVTIPMALPQTFTDALAERLVSVTELDAIEFKVQEQKK
ncbi:peptidylprolyl isomerase [Candidatus Woesearchaeota archaeon]|jgi:FKBP-type peptidyl-prolyl cis-trans isomerase 2|nr:peptidylprolyl isomerase [Candidatus Woesearchaeota archaeon]MBT5396924.1 peptidylprolyl isomerase [Candidatus Woesearchaeota archaeon]MBT5924571.1 peptidylprolyl isomerase [Candidatus Woesearchaeota archaeon]MBT6367117.1 peptidylprolyl isomerase [Candidatus Woesearchaeota archaeon]MBT7762309.1 peptidylprolyl isomerase [Candidatus Woesearchaeota archaeon]